MRSRQARARCSAVSLPAAISAAAATALSSFGLAINPLSVVLHSHAGIVAEASLADDRMMRALALCRRAVRTVKSNGMLTAPARRVLCTFA